MDVGYGLDEAFTEYDTFANFLFHHRFWNEYIVTFDLFVRPAKLTNPQLYNPDYNTNGSIGSGKYTYRSLRRIKRVIINRR